MLVRIVFYKLVDGLARREGPGSRILEGIKHSSGGWKKFKKEARKTNVLKRLSQEVRVEEFDTREKEKCRATGGVCMTGRFSHRGKSWTSDGKAGQEETLVDGSEEACYCP